MAAQTIAGIAFWIGCNVLYYVGFALLLWKNSRAIGTRIVGVGALLLGPWLLLLPVAQLLFVFPLYTVFCIHGFVIPTRLPVRTIFAALAMTAAGVVALVWVIALFP